MFFLFILDLNYKIIQFCQNVLVYQGIDYNFSFSQLNNSDKNVYFILYLIFKNISISWTIEG